MRFRDDFVQSHAASEWSELSARSVAFRRPPEVAIGCAVMGIQGGLQTPSAFGAGSPGENGPVLVHEATEKCGQLQKTFC